MMYFFKRILATITILFFLGNPIYAQLTVTSKKEIELDAKDCKPSVVSVGINGVVLLTEDHDKNLENNKQVLLEILDNRLANKAKITLTVPHKASLVQHKSTENELFLVYSNLSKEQLYAFKIDLRDMTLQNEIYYALPQIRYYESAVIEDKLFLAGVKGKKGILVQIDFGENKSKITHIIQENVPAFIQHLDVIDGELCASIKSSDSRDHNLYYRIINKSSNLVKGGMIKAPKSMRILEGKLTKANNGKLSFIGTYANKKSVNPIGIFHTELNQNASFINFSDIPESAGLSLVEKKNKAKQESKFYLKINDLNYANGTYFALFELYDIVDDNKVNINENSLKLNNDSFLKMWVVNDLNYHDYNIHIFQKRMQDVAAYQFKGAYTLKLKNGKADLVNLEMNTNFTHKSFGNLISNSDKEGQLQVIDKFNGDMRKLNIQGGHLYHYNSLMDRDGNHLNTPITNTYFWKKDQYLFASVTQKENGKLAVTFYKVKS